MRTRAKKKYVASDRARRENVPWHILFHELFEQITGTLLFQHKRPKAFCDGRQIRTLVADEIEAPGKRQFFERQDDDGQTPQKVHIGHDGDAESMCHQSGDNLVFFGLTGDGGQLAQWRV